jgi:hypothetical protein
MKLQSTTGTMIIDYHPVMFDDNTPLEDWFLKIVSMEGSDAMSKKFIRKNDMFDEINERVNIGYEVIDFNTDYQVGNPITGAC